MASLPTLRQVPLCVYVCSLYTRIKVAPLSLFPFHAAVPPLASFVYAPLQEHRANHKEKRERSPFSLSTTSSRLQPHLVIWQRHQLTRLNANRNYLKANIEPTIIFSETTQFLDGFRANCSHLSAIAHSASLSVTYNSRFNCFGYYIKIIYRNCQS